MAFRWAIEQVHEPRAIVPGCRQAWQHGGVDVLHGCTGVGVMDIGYVILLLLVLVYGATAAFLYLRARQEPTVPEEAQEMPPEEPEVP